MRRHRPEQTAAHNAVALAVKAGKLKKQPCSVCGAKVAYAHHEDYSKPLDVIWFCGQHHGEHHAGKGFKRRRIGIFRRIREARNLSIPKIAKMAGMGAMDWFFLEKRKRFNFDAVLKVKEALGMTSKEIGQLFDQEVDYLEKKLEISWEEIGQLIDKDVQKGISEKRKNK